MIIASEETKKQFNEVLDETSIPSYVEFEVLSDSNQKDIYKISKASKVLETLTNGLSFVVILNEEIFDQLSDEHQKIVIKESLAGVVYDSDKDVVSLNKPDFTTHTGILEKFGHEEIITLKESIKSLYDNKKAEEDRIKAESKKSKKIKRFN